MHYHFGVLWFVFYDMFGYFLMDGSIVMVIWVHICCGMGERWLCLSLPTAVLLEF